MATTFLAKFVAANLQGDGSYIHDAAVGETPDNFDWETGDTDNAISTPGGTWPAGEPVLDHTGGASILQSTDSGIATAIPSDQFRMLLTLEMDSSPGTNYEFIRFDNATANERLEIAWRFSTPFLRIVRTTNSGSAQNSWDSGTLAVGTAYAVEIRYDNTEVADNDMLQVRVWAIGGAAGSLTSGTEAGTTGSAATWSRAVSSEGSGNFHMLGRIIVDDDPDTDLSGYDESYPSLTPTITDVNLVDLTGTAQASLSSLRWAWFDTVTPASFGAPVIQGTTETTDGSGNISLTLTGSSLTSGQEGCLVLSNSGGTIIGAYRLAVD